MEQNPEILGELQITNINQSAVDVNMLTLAMQEIFKNHDTDNSGTMSSHEMRGAANEAGTKGEEDTQIRL